MREKLDYMHSISFTQKEAEKIKEAATEFRVSFSAIVRECVLRDLNKLKDNLRKQKQAEKNKEIRENKTDINIDTD